MLTTQRNIDPSATAFGKKKVKQIRRFRYSRNYSGWMFCARNTRLHDLTIFWSFSCSSLRLNFDSADI